MSEKTSLACRHVYSDDHHELESDFILVHIIIIINCCYHYYHYLLLALLLLLLLLLLFDLYFLLEALLFCRLLHIGNHDLCRTINHDPYKTINHDPCRPTGSFSAAFVCFQVATTPI